MNSKYANAFQEVYIILEYLIEEDYEKIPNDFKEMIEIKRNKNYQYELNEELDLKNQKMLPETKAILFNLFRDYLSTTEQKEKITKMQKEELEKIRIKKKEEFDNSINKVNLENNNTLDDKEPKELVKAESFWKRFIRNILKH